MHPQRRHTDALYRSPYNCPSSSARNKVDLCFYLHLSALKHILRRVVATTRRRPEVISRSNSVKLFDLFQTDAASASQLIRGRQRFYVVLQPAAKTGACLQYDDTKKI